MKHASDARRLGYRLYGLIIIPVVLGFLARETPILVAAFGVLAIGLLGEARRQIGWADGYEAARSPAMEDM